MISNHKYKWIEDSNQSLARQCTRCGKAILYKKWMPMDAWRRLLREFTKKHKTCLEKEKTREG